MNVVDQFLDVPRVVANAASHHKQGVLLSRKQTNYMSIIALNTARQKVRMNTYLSYLLIHVS